MARATPTTGAVTAYCFMAETRVGIDWFKKKLASPTDFGELCIRTADYCKIPVCRITLLQSHISKET